MGQSPTIGEVIDVFAKRCVLIPMDDEQLYVAVRHGAAPDRATIINGNAALVRYVRMVFELEDRDVPEDVDRGLAEAASSDAATTIAFEGTRLDIIPVTHVFGVKP